MTGSKSRVLRGLFVNGQGLRAGWSVLIFLAIVVVLSALGDTLVGHFFPAEDMHVVSPDTQIPREAAVVLGLFIATWVMSKIEKRPVLSYGLTDSRMVRRFFFGLAVGLLSISALVGALWTTHLLVFDGRVLSVRTYGNTRRCGRRWICSWRFSKKGSSGISALHFDARPQFLVGGLIIIHYGAGHNAGESPGIITAGLGGLVFCLSLWLTGSLFGRQVCIPG